MTVSTIKLVDSETVEIGVKDSQRAKVAEQLSNYLASTYTLYMKTLYYHWNVTGKQFNSLHTLFETQYNELHTAGDAVAERIRALGHFAPGTFKAFTQSSAVSEDNDLPSNAEQMVKNLIKDHECCSLEARKVMKVAQEAEDEVTADMMIARMSIHDETAWMLRAFLE